jgi:type III secretion protein C
VIETDVKNTLDFGLQWAVGGSFPGLGFGVGNFPHPGTPFANTMKGMSNTSPQGLSQIPIGRGFDLGVIGDIITHKGKAFFSLGALVSALQADGSSTVVLNQKIITQDNKNSKIFSGDNIPFTGSVVQTVGQGQQTSANIEYRDVGVSLSITPVLGEGKIITLDIVEEITEAAHEDVSRLSSATVGGIRTSKTNMATQAHVPDNHFLVISGMIRNAKTKEKTGIPCLGGLPIIGAAFSRTIDHNEKKNIIIFVRPRIINSVDDYREITAAQENLFKSQTHLDEFEDGIQLLQQ